MKTCILFATHHILCDMSAGAVAIGLESAHRFALVSWFFDEWEHSQARFATERAGASIAEHHTCGKEFELWREEEFRQVSPRHAGGMGRR